MLELILMLMIILIWCAVAAVTGLIFIGLLLLIDFIFGVNYGRRYCKMIYNWWIKE